MEIIKIEPKSFPEPSAEFQRYFDSYLDLCEFELKEKLGLLFYMGAILPGKLNNSDPRSTEFKQIIKAMSLYAKSTGDFLDYGDLNDSVFIKWIYNANLAISMISGDEESIDENLRKLPFIDTIVGKAQPNDAFLDKFKGESFSLNTIQNFNDCIFSETGSHLEENDYSCQRAYEAGFAYRMLMSQMDIKGTHYLLSRIDAYLSPLFMALFYAPFLYVFNYDAFKANHLFSQILNNFYGGQNSRLIHVVQSIHVYHQFIFYKENSVELQDKWLFNKPVEEGSAVSVFLNALAIRKTQFAANTDIIKQSGEVYDSSLIDAKISGDEFLMAILNVLHKKYSISGGDEFAEDSGKWNTGWNNKGEYIQFLVILFYETCLHALVVDEIEIN